MTPGGLLEQTERAWLRWRHSIALVQVYLRPDVAWEVGQYGNNAEPCDGGFRFRMFRSTPGDGQRMDGPLVDAAREFAGWLAEQGWQVAGPHEYAQELGRVAVAATKAEENVGELFVQFVRTEQMDGIALSSRSVTLPGDANELFAAKYEGATLAEYQAEFEPLPQREAPQSRPVFVEQRKVAERG